MSLKDHARTELLALFGETEDDMNIQMMKNVLDLIELFSSQGHSGMSAPYAINLFTKLAQYQPLCPLKGDAAEWMEVGEQNGKPLYQNKRCSHVFKEGDLAYNLDGVVFEDPDGSRYTNGESRVYVTFPYTPSTRIVKRDADGKYDKVEGQLCMA